ncbi:MAG TPA: hypothetical protein VE954_23120 [Oligoflexus sp.]|uniref:hypothetical protein n=1 Tax=Oligoflexus sp. TaxID=1971216 RepID=UPI002D5FAD62|nr:hypothetical protein [Oligoflexus sp.]HYX36004.1 hypothetical protein [Oligoflexus sp.]
MSISLINPRNLRLLLLLTALVSSAEAVSQVCNPLNPPDTFEAFPDGTSYVSGPAKGSLAWPGETFQSMMDSEIVECSDRDSRDHLEITSGCLTARQVGNYLRGYTDSYSFRALAVGWSEGKRVKWTDQINSYRAHIKRRQREDCPTCGLHLFTRYRTENDLYVASLRQDGLATIKKKHCGTYTTLAEKKINGLAGNTWYKVQFAAIGRQLTLSLDDKELLKANDATFSWGTSGIRTDYVDVYLDDWKVTAP